MQFKRGGWQYSEADGVVTMPGNARQAFPAKRDGGGGGGDGERRTGDGWGRENGDNHTIRDVRVVYRIFAFTQFSTRANASLAILRNCDLSSATRCGATQSSSGSVAVFNPRMLLRYGDENAANICILRFRNIGKITTNEFCVAIHFSDEEKSL